MEQELTKDQRKFYRKQFTTIMISTGLVLIAYAEGIRYFIKILLEQKQLWTLSLVVLFVQSAYILITQSKKETELIQERIERRQKKNKKTKEVE